MLIEAEKRRDNFDLENSVGVVLADGQTWYLPKPWVVIRPTFVDGVAMNPYRFFSYSAKLDVLLDAIAAAEDLDTVICGAATLAAYLLRQQYDLADDELDQLLAYRIGEAESMAWTRQAMEVATGRFGKKVRGAGGD